MVAQSAIAAWFCCCRGHLRKFKPVTSKNGQGTKSFSQSFQDLSQAFAAVCSAAFPTSSENYENFSRISPRIGKRCTVTDKGEMKILRTNMFRNSLVGVDENNAEVGNEPR